MGESSVAYLPDRGIVEVGGPEAEPFLHNLVTNTIVGVKPGDAVFAGLLTSKGKILHDFVIWRRDADTFLLDCPKSGVQDLVKRLSLYKLRAKVTIGDLSSALSVGVAWGDSEGWPVSAGLESAADPRFAPLGQRFFAPYGFVWPDPQSVSAPAAERYHSHRIAHGLPEGGKDYAYGETFPHEACYGALNGVDYKKGCYVGQEIVSRMHHLGAVKSGIAIAEAARPLTAGAEIVAGGVPAGRIGSVADRAGIAMLRLDRVAEAIGNGLPILADGQEITVRNPEWRGAPEPVS